MMVGVVELAPDAATWFLSFSSSNPTADNGDGRPWGDGTAMAARATAPGGPFNPWDENCSVSTFVGGYPAMAAIRDSLELAISEANAAGNTPGKCGRVYLTDWRFNCMRDLSENNAWALDPWPSDPTGTQAARDQTAIGLVLRLMQAGVIVRIMLWCPPAVSAPPPPNLAAQIADHFYAARLVGAENTRLMARQAPASGEQIGVVALDMRTADSTITGSHHQKTVVIRGAVTSVAYAGGVDLAYTRRDAKPLSGDWQSGNAIPDPSAGWPQDTTTSYASTTEVKRFSDRQAADLPVNVYGDSSSLLTRQIWHDQHVRLQGPIVATLESQFTERWRDTTEGRAFDISSAPDLLQNWRGAQVMFSTSAAIDATGGVVPLPLTVPEPAIAGATTLAQMWRTIPWRKTRTGPPFQRAEFTVMAGIANAVKQARELIWMFDQYFWSRPLARLLNAQLLAHPGLRLIVILPPHADSMASAAHQARALALGDLTAELSTTGSSFDQVAVYDLWLDPQAPADSSRSRGIYVHAKTHTYDDGLLVCGSANLNRRSFTCDSEIACAILDPAIVLSHQIKLWAAIFNGATRPDIDLSVTGSGKSFFDQFRAAVAAGPATLIPDPWQAANPALPNNVPRDQSVTAYYTEYGTFLDPSSISTKVESQIHDAATGNFRGVRLDEIVSRLENIYVGSRWPWRHP
jgi:phosphatidylserine/phosphatidylglycerophosphate/cardiolipin synthase-like enzyme